MVFWSPFSFFFMSPVPFCTLLVYFWVPGGFLLLLNEFFLYISKKILELVIGSGTLAGL